MAGKDKVEILEECGAFYLAWWIAEDHDFGGYVGDHRHGPAELRQKLKRALASDAPTLKLDRDYFAAEVAALEIDPKPSKGEKGYWWETRGEAAHSLKQVRVRMKLLLEGATWPEWAIKAQAEGWKPPKGWKP